MLRRCPIRLAMFCLLATAAACLPDKLSDAVVLARISAARDAAAQVEGQADANGAVADGAAPACEPNPGEELFCKDQAASMCDGCVDCKLRTVLAVNTDKALATVTDSAKLQFDAKTSFSMEMWVSVHQAPAVGAGAPLLILTKPKFLAVGPSTPYFEIGVVHAAAGLVLACLTGQTGVKDPEQVALSQPIQTDSWHHIRCGYTAKGSALRMAVDGGKVFDGTGKATKSGFGVGTILAIGRIPTDVDAATAEPFSGLLDELRIVSGTEAEVWNGLKYRYNGDEKGLVALYHMDLSAGLRTLRDASPNKLDAEQTTVTPGSVVLTKKDAALPSQVESCYDFGDAGFSCSGSAAPWCH